MPAIEIHPYYTRNQSPLVQIFGLPPAEGGTVAGKGRTDVRLVLDVASIYAGDDRGRNLLRLDGEIYRLTLALRYGLGERLELGVDLPYVWQTGGHLDSFIDGFHQTFNLPQGGRDLWYRDRLRYLSVHDGRVMLDYEEPQDGFGDVLLSLGYQLVRTEGAGGSRTVTLRPALKVPTGNGDKLTGSGSFDFSLRLAGTDSLLLAPWDLTWFWTAGALAMSEGDVLSEEQNNLVGFGTLGIGWEAASWLAFMLQFDGHTAFYGGSGLHQLDGASVQVTIGTEAALPGKILFDFGVTEDLVVETSPDVVFHVALRRKF